MRLRQLAIEIFIIALIGLAFGLLGPFGTFAMPTAVRLLYWIGLTLIGYAIFRPVQAVALWLAEETLVPTWAALLASAALASLPLTAVVGFAISGMRYDAQRMIDIFPLLYAQVFGIGLAIFVLIWLLFGGREPSQKAAADTPAPPVPLDIAAVQLPERPDAPFFKRLPERLGHNLVCLEMQDHYVCAHTLSGSEMILMRLRDAIAELEGVEGMQVHRSWWVARDQVRAIRREGRAIRLELANGLLAPVSRNRQEALKREGWL
jgi:LytTr DNA-binding domain-containing protein